MDEFKYMYAVCVNLILTVGSLERNNWFDPAVL